MQKLHYIIIDNIILNSTKITAELKGNNYKIKSNENTMIYFYGKLFNNIKQKKIDK